MLRFDAERAVSFCDGLTRRDFLHAGALSALGLTLPGWMEQKARGAVKDRDVNCIMLFLVGGPSHIDTWDPKPDAPAEVRGPFQPIATSVPGMRLTEIFPKMAQQLRRSARRELRLWAMLHPAEFRVEGWKGTAEAV